MCVGHHYKQTNTNSVNKTWTLLQTIVIIVKMPYSAENIDRCFPKQAYKPQDNRNNC